MSIWDWFTTAGDNDTAGALWPENMPRADVNNSARQMQADIRAWANDPGWIEYGDGNGTATINFASATSFTVAGADVTAVYHAGRRIKAMGSSTGTIYGTIASSSFSTNTTVNVEWDGAGALANESLTIWVSALPQLNPQLPAVVLQRPNLLPNGEFQVWQEGTSFSAIGEDTYAADGCIVLSNGSGTIDAEQDATVKPTGAYASLKATVTTANRKFGFLFPIESRDAAAVIGGKASLSFKARGHSGNSTLETIRAAIIAWSGTADSITSDAVDVWNAAGVDPTLATNWTYESAPFSITLGTTFREYRINNIPIDASGAANVAVFIWVDDTDATVGDILYLADVNLVPGEVATPIMRQDFGTALRSCQRYFCKTFPYETAPAQNAGGPSVLQEMAEDGGRWVIQWRFPVEMRAQPSITTYNPSAANSSARNLTDGTNTAVQASLVGASGTGILPISFDANDANNRMLIHAAADARL